MIPITALYLDLASFFIMIKIIEDYLELFNNRIF